MGQGSIAESVDEYQPVSLDPEIILVGPSGIIDCCSTNEEGKILVATTHGIIALYNVEEKKQLKTWLQNKRITKIFFNSNDNTFCTGYFCVEGEDPKICDALSSNYIVFLDTIATKTLKSEIAGDGILLWKFDEDKSSRFIGGKFPVVHKHQEKILVQRKPGLIEEYFEGEFITYIDAKIT